MARLVIKHIGPLKNVDIELAKVNLFIGKQSSGKSTLAKIVSFCTWLDKNTQKTDNVLTKGAWHLLKSYSRLHESYFSDDSRIFYEGDNIAYAFNYTETDSIKLKNPHLFDENAIHYCNEEFFWEARIRNTNPKVIYIPAERNFVSAVPNLRNYAEDNDNLQEFVNMWYDVKRKFTNDSALDLLNLGVKYFYKENDYSDNVQMANGMNIPLLSASSGLQSIIPLLVLVNWLSNGIYKEEKPFSPAEYEEIKKSLANLTEDRSDDRFKKMTERLVGFISGKIYSHTQFIIEEPEQNLFPSTQCELMNYLVAAINHGKKHRLLITTHSPYIVNHLNLLFKAHDTGKSISEASLNYDDTAVYAIIDGELKDLKLQNAHLVDPNYLSQIITDIYDAYETLDNE